MGMEAGPGPICARCHDDYWQLSGRGWCIPCEKRVFAAEQIRRAADDGQDQRVGIPRTWAWLRERADALDVQPSRRTVVLGETFDLAPHEVVDVVTADRVLCTIDGGPSGIQKGRIA